MTRFDMLQVLRWVILTPVTALVAFGMSLLVLTAFSDSGRPHFFGLEMFVVTSGSMSPSIAAGDVVLVRVGDSQPKVGDVITFQPQESSLFITHRVIAVHSRPNAPMEFVTKGDANPKPDLEPVLGDQVVGAVTTTFPVVGRVVLALRDPRFVLMVGISVALAEGATALQRRGRRTLLEQVQQ